MSSFTLTVKALADLKSIAQYTQQEWGSEQRRIYLRQIDETFHLLAKRHDLGSTCDYIREGYRKHPVSSHLIFYRSLSNTEIEVIRVLHKRMDVRSSLAEPRANLERSGKFVPSALFVRLISLYQYFDHPKIFQAIPSLFAAEALERLSLVR